MTTAFDRARINPAVMTEETAAYLTASADYMQEHGWTRGEWERRGRVCMMGAILKVVPHDVQLETQERLRAYITNLTGNAWTTISMYNDGTCKSRQQAIRTLREAASWNGEQS